MTEHRFVFQGQQMQLSSEQVIEALKDVPPGPIRKHAVEINGVDYPVNQALSRVTGIDVADCNTGVARKTFQKLGFTVKRVA